MSTGICNATSSELFDFVWLEGKGQSFRVGVGVGVESPQFQKLLDLEALFGVWCWVVKLAHYWASKPLSGGKQAPQWFLQIRKGSHDDSGHIDDELLYEAPLDSIRHNPKQTDSRTEKLSFICFYFVNIPTS